MSIYQTNYSNEIDIYARNIYYQDPTTGDKTLVSSGSGTKLPYYLGSNGIALIDPTTKTNTSVLVPNRLEISSATNDNHIGSDSITLSSVGGAISSQLIIDDKSLSISSGESNSVMLNNIVGLSLANLSGSSSFSPSSIFIADSKNNSSLSSDTLNVKNIISGSGNISSITTGLINGNSNSAVTISPGISSSTINTNKLNITSTSSGNSSSLQMNESGATFTYPNGGSPAVGLYSNSKTY